MASTTIQLPAQPGKDTTWTNYSEPPRAISSGEDYYAFLLGKIKQMSPDAVLLRGPAHLHPSQTASGTSDIDVLVPTNIEFVRSFLKGQGFYPFFKPQAYLERYGFRAPEISKPYTVDLYKSERWGWGFRVAHNGHVPVDPCVACLLHAVADGKGTGYFERALAGPPWKQGCRSLPSFGSMGRLLWKSESTALLTLFLLLKGAIRPEIGTILRSVHRKSVYRIWQLLGKAGLEVALLGVDGAGKSTLATALLSLPASVKVIYMGPRNFQTRIMRFVSDHKFPAIVRKVTFRYEMLYRRLGGWLFAKRGWVVIYDRHPGENRPPWKGTLKNKTKHVVDWMYGWPADMTFWLTGDYSIIHERKKDFPVETLAAFDQRYKTMLEDTGAPFETIDVTAYGPDAVRRAVSQGILRRLSTIGPSREFSEM